MKHRRLLFAWWGLFLSAAVVCAGETNPMPAPAKAARIFPDYSGVVIAPNMAPLNFRIEETGSRYRVNIHGARGQPIDISGGRDIVIPTRPWQALLQANEGTNLWVDISVKNTPAGWTSFATITNRVAAEPIDGYLVYRLLKPLYNMFAHLGIYQRNLASYEETVVLHNRSFQGGCVNCHTFLDHRADSMTLQIRHPGAGNPMLLVQSNTVYKVARTVGYTSWHPSGRLIAYSANKLSLFYHTVGETRDVYDAESNLGIYRVDQNRVVVPPAIARPDRQETWPSWSPDGKYLYFCSGPVLPLDRYREIRYDLVRIAYDIDKDAWGEVETLVSATKTGLSATQPRVSPDGRFLLFCMCQYGHFPIYHPDADLYLLSLATGKLSRLDINSSEADTWHCWSSNGRWIVFSSKRDQLFFVDMPYASEREAIWRIQIAKHGRDWKSFDLRQLAKATEGLTGSEIEAVFVEALYQACDEEQEPTDLTIAGILNDFVPLSKTMAEQIAGLRTWAKGRARFATTSVAESKIRRLAA